MSGFFRASARLAALIVVLTAGCNYGLRSDTGFPDHIRTIFIAPFGDDTGRFDVSQEIHRQMSEQLPRSLGLRLAGETVADALVRGRVTRYDASAQNYRPGEPGRVDVVQQQVQITMTVQIIDVRNSVILYESSSVTGQGVYQPDTQSEDAARLRAIETLIQQVINGAQSQW